MLVPLLAAALLAGAPAGCTQRYVFFDVTDISFDERVSAHWSYDFEGETLDEPDRIQATLDTVATATCAATASSTRRPPRRSPSPCCCAHA